MKTAAGRIGRASLLVLAAALASFLGAAHAGKLYRWTDAQGIIRYADKPPLSTAGVHDLQALGFRAEPSPAVRLRLTTEENATLAWAENVLDGPVEVRLSFARTRNARGEPQLPARALVPAGETTLVARIYSENPYQDGDFALQLEAVPGNPSAAPRETEYLYPLRTTDLRVEQGYGGSYSHNDEQNRYAVDFAAPIGTPVLAARDGVVMQVENDFDQAGLNREKLGGRANFVRVVHDDGSMALYAHLREAGVMVRTGRRVRTGQLIGYSGNTGFTSGPHLHFALQVNRGMRLVSVPFRMFGPHGILRFGEEHKASARDANVRTESVEN